MAGLCGHSNTIGSKLSRSGKRLLSTQTPSTFTFFAVIARTQKTRIVIHAIVKSFGNHTKNLGSQFRWQLKFLTHSEIERRRSAFRVKKVIRLDEIQREFPFSVEWYCFKDEGWRGKKPWRKHDRLPTKGEYLLKHGDGTSLRPVSAILELVVALHRSGALEEEI